MIHVHKKLEAPDPLAVKLVWRGEVAAEVRAPGEVRGVPASQRGP